jgi:hypothetical protein
MGGGFAVSGCVGGVEGPRGHKRRAHPTKLRAMDVMFTEFAFIDTFSALVDDGDMSTQQLILCFGWQSSKHVLL